MSKLFEYLIQITDYKIRIENKMPTDIPNKVANDSKHGIICAANTV